MKYAGNPVCSYCCTDEHARCLCVWATQDQRFWFECGCDCVEARDAAAWDEEKDRAAIQRAEQMEEMLKTYKGMMTVQFGTDLR